MFHQCQTAFTPSTKIPLFTFQHLFSLSLQSGESHRSRVIFPDCQISNFHFFFFSGLGIVHDITHFLKQHIFFSSSICGFTCNQLGHPPPLPVNIFPFSVLTIVKSSNFRIFNSFSQKFQFYTSWQLYLATQLFG